MKATELIKELQKMVDKHGDQPVRYCGENMDDNNIFEVCAYTDKNDAPDGKNKAVEIYIH